MAAAVEKSTGAAPQQQPATDDTLEELRAKLSSAPYQVGFDDMGLSSASSMVSLLGREAPWQTVKIVLAALSDHKQCRGVEAEHALPTDDEDSARERALDLLTNIYHADHLQYVSLRWLPCPSEGWEVLSTGSPTIRLRILELERCKLKGSGLQHVCDFIARQPALESVSLAHNPLGVSGAQAVLEAVAKSGASLSELSLAGCSLSKFQEEDAAVLMAIDADVGGVALFSALVELNLSANRLQAVGLAALQPLICRATRLQSLNLRSNSIGMLGLENLSSVLSSLPCLRQLDIGGNQLPASACASLAKALPPVLHSLDLSNNPLTSSGLQDLCAGVWASASLCKLDLSRCKLCHVGMAALASIFSTTTSLTHLNLADNKIKDGGFSSVVQQLQSCTALRHLDLTACGLSDASEDALTQQLCTSCEELRTIRLVANKLSATVQQRVQSCIQAR